MHFFNVSFFFFFCTGKKKLWQKIWECKQKGGNRNRFIVNTALKRLGWKSRFLRKSNDSDSATHLHIYGISISSLAVEEDSLEAFVHSPKTKFAEGLPSCQSHRIANFKFDRTDNDTIDSSFYLFDELIISKSLYFIYIYF